MEILIKRLWKKSNYTIGKVYIDGKYFSDCLEDTDRGLSSDMSLDEIKKIKVKDNTAIPVGLYDVLYTYSPRFKRMLPLINNVLGYEGVRFHAGNSIADTSGCILLGKNTKVGMVTESRVTCNKFYKLIEEAIYKKGEAITLKIE